jgi:hypothetical protein
MARTSRNGAPAATVDALDNLNLDDMFADDGDALFDGLDIDLGNMDDIAESSVAAAALAKTSSTTSNAALPLHRSEPSSPEAASLTAEPGSGKRRTTKRKIKSPMFYEDEDDDYVEEPSKKKKRGSSKAAPPPKALPFSKSKKGLAKGVVGAAAPTAAGPGAASSLAGAASAVRKGKLPTAGGGTAKGKKAQQRAGSMPPPAGRASSVAAAGQFGGRQKKGASASFSIPGTSKAKGKAGAVAGAPVPASPTAASVSSTMSNATSASSELFFRGGPPAAQRPSQAVSATLAQIHATHPGLKLSSFCGLLPSNTLFYPFMPALPQEPSFKHRKVFAMIDRIHTSFMSHVTSPTSTPGLPPAQETEVIFQLMQDAFREEKPSGNDAATLERNKSIGNAISALRRSIGVFEKSRLAGDLLAVCALLKRQYDFLTQNLSNMEQWCKNHLPEADYASVYHEPASGTAAGGADGDPSKAAALSVLGTFKSPEIKVRVLCSHFKEPKAGPLLAVLPQRFVSPATPSAAADSKPAPKTKKRKLAISPLTSSGSRMAGMAAPGAALGAVQPPKTAPTYSERRPAKRRQNVSDLIARTARELESKYSLRFDDQRTLIERQQNETRQLVEDDPVQSVHTLGMWRWLEKSGYFTRITDTDIRWRLEGGISPEGPDQGSQPSQRRFSDNHVCLDVEDAEFVPSRLQYLLCECTDGLTNDSDGDGDDFGELCEPTDPYILPQETCADFQSTIHALGLKRDVLPISLGTINASGTNDPLDDETPATTKIPSHSEEGRDSGDELGGVISAMISDLQELNHFNNRRTAFLESMATIHQRNEASGKKAEETSLISRCQQLLRKSKETKGKNGKVKTAKKDEYALPW